MRATCAFVSRRLAHLGGFATAPIALVRTGAGLARPKRNVVSACGADCLARYGRANCPIGETRARRVGGMISKVRARRAAPIRVLRVRSQCSAAAIPVVSGGASEGRSSGSYQRRASKPERPPRATGLWSRLMSMGVRVCVSVLPRNFPRDTERTLAGAAPLASFAWPPRRALWSAQCDIAPDIWRVSIKFVYRATSEV